MVGEVNIQSEKPSFDRELLITQCDNLKTRYEELFAFIYSLHNEGFRISPIQFVAVQKLLIALIANGEIENNLSRLKTYIAPLVCFSPADQENFYHYFDEWLKKRQLAEHSEIGHSAPDIFKSEEITKEAKSENQTIVLRLAVIAFLIFASVIILYLLAPSTKISGIVRDNANQQVISNAKISFNNQTQLTNSQGQFSFNYPSQSNRSKLSVEHEDYQSVEVNVETSKALDIALAHLTPTPKPESSLIHKRTPTITPTSIPTPLVTPSITPGSISFYNQYYYWLIFGVFLLPYAIYGLWQLLLLLRRRQLEKWRDKEKPDLNRITVKGANTGQLYQSSQFRRFAQEMRRHRLVSSNVLDAALTVEATVRKVGFFTPIYGVRQLTPEYLILIDRRSFRDQKARLEDEIIACLRKEGVFVDRYYFNGDPRVCWKEDRRTNYFSLPELAFKHPEHRLLIFSDGEGLLDLFTNQPQRWLDLLSAWNIRALLSSNPVWGYNEWILEHQAMLPVLSSRKTDFPALLEIIRSGKVSKGDDFSDLKDYPQTLLEESEQWLTETPKLPAELTILLLELRYYLGSEGYLLLCACAVYPVLLWDLTFYLGYQLIEVSSREEILEKLVILPWFQHGAIPDWLRIELLASLPSESEVEIRQVIEQLLMSYLDNPRRDFELVIAQKTKGKESFFRSLKRYFTDFRRKRFFYDFVKTEKTDSPLREYVFLKFVSGNKLAVEIPWRLSNALSVLTEDTPRWKIGQDKALLSAILTSAIAITILLLIPPQSIPPQLIPIPLTYKVNSHCPAETRPFPSYDVAFAPSEEWCRNNPNKIPFQLSQNYLEAKKEINEELPWRQFAAKTEDLKTNWKDYLFAALRYAYEGNIESDWIVQENPMRKWYHAPWMHTTKYGREFLHGLTQGRGSCEKELIFGQVCEMGEPRPIQNWTFSAYNEPGGYYFAKVWQEMYNVELDASKPNPKPNPKNFGDEGFPEGTVAIQFYFTAGDLPYLKNSPTWDADIKRGKEPPQKVRLLQVNIAIKDKISPTGWVFGTFIHHDDAPEMKYSMPLDAGKRAWLNVVPIGLMFGTDAGEFPELKEPFETYLNDTIPVPQHYGCEKRLNGPVDNARSSCISCHALAEVAQDFTKITFKEKTGCSTKEDIDYWFKNINPANKNAVDRTFTPSTAGRKIFSLDYSLQLSNGIERCCQANVCQCKIEDVSSDGVF